MRFDESLARRICDLLVRKRNIEERKMFGRLCFLFNGNALAGVWKDRLITQLGPAHYEEATLEPHVRAFVSFGGQGSLPKLSLSRIWPLGR